MKEKRITLEEMKERTHGPIGTPRRDALEDFLKKNIYKTKKRKTNSKMNTQTEQKDVWVECNVCKHKLKNWVGSTPCCGSIAFILNDDGTYAGEEPNPTDELPPTH